MCPPPPAPPDSAGIHIGTPGTAPELQPHSPSSICSWAELSQNRSVQAGLGSAARRGVARHGTAPSGAIPSSSAGPTSAGATTAVPVGHGSMWRGHVPAGEPQRVEPGSAPSCPHPAASAAQTTAPSQAAPQPDLATFWQRGRHRHTWAATAPALGDGTEPSRCWCRPQAVHGACPAAYPPYISPGELCRAREVCMQDDIPSKGLCLAQQPPACPSAAPSPARTTLLVGLQ